MNTTPRKTQSVNSAELPYRFRSSACVAVLRTRMYSVTAAYRGRKQRFAMVENPKLEGRFDAEIIPLRINHGADKYDEAIEAANDREEWLTEWMRPAFVLGYMLGRTKG